jgi:hypothetical protein
MRFKDEDTRHEFHQLDTNLQYAFIEFESRLNSQGKFVNVERVIERSEIIMRVDAQLQIPVSDPEDPIR